MSVAQTVTPNQQITLHFFDYLFGAQKGHLCIATQSPGRKDFKQEFFEWPTDRIVTVKYVEEQTKKKNVWFCVNLLRQPERKKEFCLPSAFAWADLDYIIPTHNGDTPDEVPYPTCVVESSPARFQAYWKIEGEPVPPDVAEDFSRKLAYSLGADKSGWDLTQLLRIPFTNNFKYDPMVQVKILEIGNAAYATDVFDRIKVASVDVDQPDIPLPDNLPTLENVIYKYQAEGRVSEDFSVLYATTPPESADWSGMLWRFIHECFRMGMTEEEALVVANAAGCNKYKRDNRPISYLWRDVTKAAQEYKRTALLISETVDIVTMPHISDWDDFEEDAFIKDYKEWANQATDAPEQYHELSCFITLSAILSSGLYVRTADHPDGISPNLWGLVLGESTLTRKTTAMQIATSMLQAIDPELIVATDGSVEGLFTSLSHRPKRASMFVRDEISGFFDSLKRKDYLAGMRETLTQLYDAPPLLTRVLRKETITVTQPYFIFFGGGIRDRVYSIIDEEWILSGFIPRFLVVSGENDLSRLRRIGPPTEFSTERRDRLITDLADMRDRFHNSVESTIAGQTINMPVQTEAKLTQEAWDFMGDVEGKMTSAGIKSDMSHVALPTFGRLTGHLLKMSLLVAASRKEPDSANQLLVELHDVKQAAFYVERWGHYSIDLVRNAGHSDAEKLIGRALRLIRTKEGMTKSEFMQRLKLTARDSKELIETMSQRGLINVHQAGRGSRLFSIKIGGA